MTELRLDDLKCCGNCEHMYHDVGYGFECKRTGKLTYITESSCEMWELDSEIWERIYNKLPKRAEPITVSEDEYEKLFKRRE